MSPKILLTTSLLFCVSVLRSQMNLVPNFSFEDNVSFCNGTAGSLWNTAVPDWNTVVVNGSTPDLMRPCMPTDWQTPNNISGTQTPSHGISYAGLLGTHSFYTFPNGREYIQVPLITPLSAGASYRIRYKASLAEKSNGATPLGMALGSSPFTFPSLVAYQAINPLPSFSPAGASYSSANAITDKTNWTTISFDYTPSVANLQYLLIGNIDNTTLPTSVPGVGLAGSVGPGAYYYIDEVEVFEITEFPASATNLSSSINMIITPNPTNDRVEIQFPFQSILHINITNSMGQELYRYEGPSSSHLSIDSHAWPSGLYFVKFIGKDKQVKVEKIVVQH